MQCLAELEEERLAETEVWPPGLEQRQMAQLPWQVLKLPGNLRKAVVAQQRKDAQLHNQRLAHAAAHGSPGASGGQSAKQSATKASGNTNMLAAKEVGGSEGAGELSSGSFPPKSTRVGGVAANGATGSSHRMVDDVVLEDPEQEEQEAVAEEKGDGGPLMAARER